MENEILIELPIPPRSDKEATGFVANRPEDALVVLSDGKMVTGELRRYVSTEDTISFFLLRDQKLMQIPVSQIKSIELNKSRQFNSTDHYISKSSGDVVLPPERQEYELDFVDGSNTVGETLGYVEDKNGIHLFIAQAFYNYHHLFVPFAALKNHRIGPQIGQVLVQKKTVTNEQLDKGLQKQQQMRNMRLGDFLTSEDIVTQPQLEAALKRQQATPNLRLGDALIQEGVVTQAQLEVALEKQKNSRSTPLGEILLTMGALTQADLNKTLAMKLGIPFVNLRKFNVEQEVLSLIPEKVARKHMAMPLCLQDHKIIVAIEDPTNRDALEDIRFNTNYFIEPVIATRDDIEWALSQYYGLNISLLADELEEEDNDLKDAQDRDVSESDNALVRIVNKMIMDAHQQGASDIHIEPYPGKRKTIIRFRKDGTLIPYVELSPKYRFALVSRIKIMCQLDISERRKPQDGKIDFKKFGPAAIELRVATIPTAGGLEDVVMRLLANGEPLPLEQMDLSASNLSDIKTIANQPHGLFLVCGPTGSGKTTTLHSVLGHINTPEQKIWTAEDPVEITQPGLRQVQVNTKIELTFANAMRAFLRADPDVIMVGEMRDEETVKIGVEASLTGHLVFSTLHTNSAPESVVRLLDMGMDPYNFADALLGILAQRLTKRLCKHCKKSYIASEDELLSLCDEYFGEIAYSDLATGNDDASRTAKINLWKKIYGNSKGEITLYEAKGCDECRDTGYNGRIAIHELLVAGPIIKKLIQARSSVADLLAMALAEGMLTLKQDGIEKVLQGHTDMRQIHAVCMK